MEQIEPTMIDGLLEAMRNDPELGPRYREIEEIEREVNDVLEAVDLSIAFSPVLMNAGDSLRDAVEDIYEGDGGKYVIREPYKMVAPDELKVMRARFLIMRGREMHPKIEAMFKR